MIPGETQSALLFTVTQAEKDKNIPSIYPGWNPGLNLSVHHFGAGNKGSPHVVSLFKIIVLERPTTMAYRQNISVIERV